MNYLRKWFYFGVTVLVNRKIRSCSFAERTWEGSGFSKEISQRDGIIINKVKEGKSLTMFKFQRKFRVCFFFFLNVAIILVNINGTNWHNKNGAQIMFVTTVPLVSASHRVQIGEICMHSDVEAGNYNLRPLFSNTEDFSKAVFFEPCLFPVLFAVPGCLSWILQVFSIQVPLPSPVEIVHSERMRIFLVRF